MDPADTEDATVADLQEADAAGVPSLTVRLGLMASVALLPSQTRQRLLPGRFR
jgi:hypothetical protein